VFCIAPEGAPVISSFEFQYLNDGGHTNYLPAFIIPYVCCKTLHINVYFAFLCFLYEDVTFRRGTEGVFPHIGFMRQQ
jgi:hypothetical protein